LEELTSYEKSLRESAEDGVKDSRVLFRARAQA